VAGGATTHRALIGVVPPALLGLLTGGPTLMLVVIVVYCAAQLRDPVDRPAAVHRGRGRAVGHGHVRRPGVLGVAAGPLGAILAIPLTLLAEAMLVDVDPQARWADALLRASAKEPDPAAPITGTSPSPTSPTLKRRRRAATRPSTRNLPDPAADQTGDQAAAPTTVST
jgi:AI-2 transport protein TqsA